MYCMTKYIERLGKHGIFHVLEENLAAIFKFLLQNLDLVKVKFMYCMTGMKNKEIMAFRPSFWAPF